MYFFKERRIPNPYEKDTTERKDPHGMYREASTGKDINECVRDHINHSVSGISSEYQETEGSILHLCPQLFSQT
jgi:hypothetical protein